MRGAMSQVVIGSSGSGRGRQSRRSLSACTGTGRVSARVPWVVLLAALLLPGGRPAEAATAASEPFFDVTDMRTIKTFVEDVPGSEEKRVTAVAMVDAPVSRVWRVLVDYDRLGRSIKMIQLNQISLLGDAGTQVDLTLDLPWPLKDVYCPLVFTENPSERFLKWRNSGGCSGTVRGDIALRAEGDATLLTFSISMKPHKAVPQWLINWGFKQHLPREIENVRLLVASQQPVPEGTLPLAAGANPAPARVPPR